MTTSMTNDSYQSSIIVIYRMLLATVGNSIILVVTLPMVEFFGNDQAAWTITFMILAAVACLCFFTTFAFCTVVPAVLFGLAILSAIGYKLDAIYPEVIKELQRRKTQLSA